MPDTAPALLPHPQVDWREDCDWKSIGKEPPTVQEIEGLMTRGGFNTKYWLPDRWWFDRELAGTATGRRIPFKEGRQPASMPSPYVPANVAMEYLLRGNKMFHLNPAIYP
mgnify:CR=1 FL=1